MLVKVKLQPGSNFAAMLIDDCGKRLAEKKLKLMKACTNRNKENFDLRWRSTSTEKNETCIALDVTPIKYSFIFVQLFQSNV